MNLGTPRVFISYSHDSPEHSERVLGLAGRLRGDGVDAWLDQYVAGALEEGWTRWMLNQLDDADYVLVICTETYYRRFRGQETSPTKGRGVDWEGQLITQQLYDSKSRGTKFAPVMFSRDLLDCIPEPLRATSHFVVNSDKEYEGLTTFLFGTAGVEPRPLGKGKHRSRARGTPLQFEESEPKPQRTDPGKEALCRQLEEAQERLEKLVARNEDTAGAQEDILQIKRRLREGARLTPGDVLSGRFKLLEEIGHGGFAQVWRAFDRRLKKVVAVKVLHGLHARDDTKKNRSFRGARQMAKLDHEGIVKVLETEQEDGVMSFFVMEYVSGGDLKDVILRGDLDQEARIEIIRAVGEALSHAHDEGLIHRDIKPANILLDEDGRAKLTDFDLVRALDTTGGTRRTQGLGTFVYAAPEALEHAAVADARADVYGLAMTAIFVLGGNPLKAKEMLRKPERVVEALDVPSACHKVLLHGVEWEAEDRPATVREFCESLAEAFQVIVAAHEPPAPATAEPTPPASPVIIRSTSDLERLFSEIETPHGGVVSLWREIPSGFFLMGSPKGDGFPDERPQHRVEILKPFAMAAVSVTNAQYAAFDSERFDPSKLNRPIANVSWEDAEKFCNWLGDQFDWTKGARLPTEEEWEYACRAGTTTRYWSGDSEEDLKRVAWYGEGEHGKTRAVGSKPANPWGLYDMHGNVWEWTSSKWDSSKYSKRPSGISIDPSADLTERAPGAGRMIRGAGRVIRGGSYWNDAVGCRFAFRRVRIPTIRSDYLGFRVLLRSFSPRDA